MGHVGENACKILAGRPKMRRPCERFPQRKEKNIKIDVKGIECESADRILLA